MPDRRKSGPRQKRATLFDVAKQAGVSVQTASQVMSENMTVRLPDSTRQRVKEAARVVGYVPNLMARAVRLGKTNILSVWLPLDRPTSSYLQFLKQLNHKAHENELGLMVTGLDTEVALQGVGELPPMWPSDGIVAIDSGKAAQLYRQNPGNIGTPLAIIGLETVENGDSVSYDVALGAKDGVHRLIRSGAKTVVHLTLDYIVEKFPKEQRRRGYTEAMMEEQLEPVIWSVPEDSIQVAKEFVAEMIRMHGVPDAFFCVRDSIAVGAGQALFEAGVAIPEKCMILGYGDYPEGQAFRVPISTLAIPINGIVDQAWDWLMDRIKNPKTETRFSMLPMIHEDRQSTR